MAEDDLVEMDDDIEEVQQDLAVGGMEETFSFSAFLKKRWVVVSIIVVVVGSLASFFFFQSNERITPDPMSGVLVSDKTVEKKTKKTKKKKIKYIKLFSQLEGTQVSRILKEFSFAKIRFTTEQSGNKYTILVDKEQESEARNLLAIKGLPVGGAQGYELLDSAQTLGVTEFDKRVRFLRALSGELEKAVIQLDVIEDAKVQIVLPEQRLFSVTQPPVTSSVLIRRVHGTDITDDIVYSIILLISNAVENLNPENVSVIDTTGAVLSDDIFDRIAARKEGKPIIRNQVKELEVIESNIAQSRQDAIGQPIIPDFKHIGEWFDLKWKFEKKLADKILRQLMGVLPLGGYKVAVNSDLGSLEGGKIVDIRRLSIGVVVDSRNEDIILDAVTKQQIFSTVSGASGYVKGRDSINLSRADFDLLTDQELEDIKAFKKREERKQLLKKSLSILIPILVGLGVLYGGFMAVRARFFGSKEESSILTEASKGDADFSDIKQDLDIDDSISKLVDMSKSTPQLIATTIDSLLEADIETEEAAVVDEDVDTAVVDEAGDEDIDIREEEVEEEEEIEEDFDDIDDLGFDTDFIDEDED